MFHMQDVPTSFGYEFIKKYLKITKNKKNSSKFAYIFAMQWSSPFILTNIFGKKLNNEIAFEF